MDNVVAIRASGRGRQPAAVEQLRDHRDELVALTAEGEELGARIVALARRAQVLLARGMSPANVLDDLEVLGLRQGIRMTAAAAELRLHEARVHESCVDERIPGHGKAA